MLSLNSNLVPGIKKDYKRISSSVSLLTELFKSKHRVKMGDRKGCVIRPLSLLKKMWSFENNKQQYQENSDNTAGLQIGLFSLIFCNTWAISLCPFVICSYSDYRHRRLNCEYWLNSKKSKFSLIHYDLEVRFLGHQVKDSGTTFIQIYRLHI